MSLADRCRTIADGAGAAYDDAAGTAFANTLKQAIDALTEAAAEIDRLQAERIRLLPAAYRLAGYAVTCLPTNQPLWMEGLAERISDFNSADGDPDRVIVTDRGTLQIVTEEPKKETSE